MNTIILGILIVTIGAVICYISYLISNSIYSLKSKQIDFSKETAICALEQAKLDLSNKAIKADILAIDHRYSCGLIDSQAETRLAMLKDSRVFKDYDFTNRQFIVIYKQGYEDGYRKAYEDCKTEIISKITEKEV